MKDLLMICSSLILLSIGERVAISQMMPMPSPSATVSPAPSETPISHGGGFDRPIVYSVAFQSANVNTNGASVSGSGLVVVDGGHFGVTFNVSQTFPGASHMAHIHKGPECPTSAQDTNGDGIVDVVEAGAVDGGILVNLDGDLSTFDAGSDHVSSPDANGNLLYIGSGSFSSMVEDLHRTPPDPATGIITLLPGENFNLDQAVIVIHGVDPLIKLPDSVQTVKGLTVNQSLPIACGKLIKSSG